MEVLNLMAMQWAVMGSGWLMIANEIDLLTDWWYGSDPRRVCDSIAAYGRPHGSKPLFLSASTKSGESVEITH